MGGTMKQALLVGAGPVDPAQLAAELAADPALVIAADAGGHYFLTAQPLPLRLPDFLLGDFDSLEPSERQRLIDLGASLRQFPAQKDETDLELALDLAIAEGASEIRILGALGGRIDHTLGNIGLLLNAAERGVRARLLDPGHEIWLTTDRAELTARPGWAVSLAPLGLRVRGVRTAGLLYPLCGEDLSITKPRGIHNEFVTGTATATVELEEGILLIIYFLAAFR